MILIYFLIINFSFAEDNSFPFLDNKAMGTYEFIQNNPECDGRGVVIFVLDNAVDPTIPGLTQTSTNEIKVIDMQDFSGQTVLKLEEAEIKEINGKSIIASDNTYLEGFKNIILKPSDEKYFLALLNENKSYKNSPVKDLNNNGKTNDEFSILAFKININDNSTLNFNGKIKPEDEIWVYYVDEDGDGNIDDESPKFDYKFNYDTFNFYNGDEKTRHLVTMSANIIDNELVINTCDGSHGSHCAGIAAGNDIYGANGNDGIAPGAYVVSLKIGSNVLSGGATTSESMKKAYEYGIEFMKEAGFKYAVYSMSYGIGAEEPGKTDIAEFLNKFVLDNPNVVVVTSNGNEGPGVRSTGTPAGADRIISVGAMLPPEILNNLYGSARTKNWITHFSSRGGACAKPDVVAPAGASSTVPAYEKGDAFWGTSMSCPQVAGACAVLLSAALKNEINVNNFMIKKAIKYSAKPLEGYTHVDYGNGLVDVNSAYKYLKILNERDEYNKIADYEISTQNNYYTSGVHSASYWNNGGYVPSELSKQEVSIKAIFPDYTPKEQNHNFYRVLKLKSDADWLDVDRSKVYIRGELPAKIGLVYDKSKLQKPGLYSGRISGYTYGEDNGGYADVDFQTTVIVPFKFNESNNFELELKNLSLQPGDINRIFLEIPAGASSMNIELSPVENKAFGMAMYLISPDGNHQGYGNASDENSNKPIKMTVLDNKLQKGIWEIIPYNYYQSRENSNYNLKVKFYGLDSQPEIIDVIEFDSGDKPNFTFDIFNNFNTSLKTNMSGYILGYCNSNEIVHSGKKTYSRKFQVAENIKTVEFDINMDINEYNKFTDLAVNIYDKNGKSILSSGLSRKYDSFRFTPPSPGEYTFEIEPGYAAKKSYENDWKFSLKEKYYYNDPINIKSTKNNYILYPQNNKKIKMDVDGTIPLAPNLNKNFGIINIYDINNNLKSKEIYIVF